jgi:D-lactate dehydrogenase (cytochrome)
MVLGNVAADYPDYLRDESRLVGTAESISFPETAQEVADILRGMNASRTPVTVQGARTGIAGGAVPQGGHVLNLSHMRGMSGLDRDGDRWIVAGEPGLLVAELNAALHSRLFAAERWSPRSREALRDFAASPEQFLPPDPTEKTASIGGAVSCNASGARTFAYGPMRRYVVALTVVLADGRTLELRRGRERAAGRKLALLGGEVTLPSYAMPGVKNASGYYAAEDMDAVDLFVGSEGTLGVIVQAELLLSPLPASIWGVTVFLPSEAEVAAFVRGVRERPQAERPVAIEYFGPTALLLLQRHQQDFAGFPGGADASCPAVYVEYHGRDEEETVERVSEMTEVLLRCGGSEDRTWIASEATELKRLQDFRHAVPEAVNRLIDERRRKDPGITKLSTDMAVPDDRLEQVMGMYRAGLERVGLDHAIFGHIGNNHLHVNILPREQRDHDLGKTLYAEWADEVIAMGGTVSAEHGVGKLKRELLARMYGAKGIEEMRAVKRFFDPEGILGQRNLF